ncbi:hypothetical protein C472_00349 [Halorubrum tebenquichense DSM 14210]|uniref:Uncharacterized protein n=1 Tax=Halorubrum tebenquichense DSM 14210 TaxID=1227485 RepID=M0E4J7_9EURY|nr:hypothetical protein C472_00349 [Halorubrum tebenquichense DSM 14210]
MEVKVTDQQYGTLRSVNVLSPEDLPEILDTQDWRLEEISIEGDIRESFEINEFDETTLIGHVVVDLDTLEWEFIES